MQPFASEDLFIERKAPFAIFLCVVLILCIVSIPLACAFGPVRLSFADVVTTLLHPFYSTELLEKLAPLSAGAVNRGIDAESLRLIVVDLRLPRVLLALCAGAGLATAGVVFQGILRNPLADPFTLGVSGGAAFGAALAISLGLGGAAFGFGIPAAAFGGAALALTAVLALGRIGGGLRHETLILAGVVVSALLAALIALIKALDESSVTGIVFWIMGSFQGRGWAELYMLLPGFVCGCAGAFILHGRLDMLSLGDRTARSLGLGATRMRLVLLLCAGVVTASCVAVSGIIGFVGLVVPHLCRMLLGAAHARLLPVSALLGALLLLWSDVSARTLLPGGVELPVGVVTALLGGPFFCFILGRKRGLAVASFENNGEDSRGLTTCEEHERSGGQHEEAYFGAKSLSDALEEALLCRDLTFSYGRGGEGRRPLLADISFSLSKGDFMALLGPNGSGKSTLLHCLAGDLRPDGGNVSVLGHAVSDLREKERAKLVAYMPQSPESIPALSVYQIALMGRYAHTPYTGGYSATDRRRTLHALARTGVGRLAGRAADTLSGGELQRVLLARTLAQDAPLLLLDEAVSGLDPAYRVSVMELLSAMNARGLCILAAMHDLNLAALYCRRLMFIKNGRIVALGNTHETFVPEVLEEVYDCKVTIVRHPVNGAPQALLSPA